MPSGPRGCTLRPTPPEGQTAFCGQPRGIWQLRSHVGTVIRIVMAGTRVAIATHRRKSMLTKLKLAMLISAPLLAGATTYALAQGDGPKQELLQKFDKNGDGKLDDAERADMKAAFAAKRAEHHKEMLTQYDTNKDGKLDDAERAAMRDAK